MTFLTAFASLVLGVGPAPAEAALPVSAHNCYLANRGDNPRLAEALAVGIDNIEIDLGWDDANNRLIVGHDASPRPGVAYPEFQGMITKALEEHWGRPQRPDRAPTVLTVDWKTDDPEAVLSFKTFLDAHPDWFSTAPKPAKGKPSTAADSPLTPRRLTVCLTGSEAAKDAYDALVPPGGVYRAFRDRVYGAGSPYQDDVKTLVPGPASAFHRFLTYYWGVIERGGPLAAGDWTAEEAERLATVVEEAHRQGYRIRVYCLNGGTGSPLSGYRFRTAANARIRWLAAAAAGVDWIATDEYAEIGLGLLQAPEPPGTDRPPLFRTADLEIGEAQRLVLADGTTAEVVLESVVAERDPFRGAVRSAVVKLRVNGEAVALGTGNYRLPVSVGGVRVDCPIIGDYRSNSGEDHWALEKAARVRVWPARGPWIEPETFGYPARQLWFASMTQMANEPTYVDGGEVPKNKKIYYHSGLDIGGAEGMVDVVAATDALVVSSALKRLPGHDDSPVRPRYDVVYLLDDRGWYYRYSHMASIDPAVVPGATVKKGQKIGVLGKEGGSGGWSHLHFEIKAKQPSGKWGTEEGYAFLWQAATREQGLDVVAVARPHRLVRTGDRVMLDGRGSWAKSGPLARYEWSFSNGGGADGPVVERVFDRPGMYSETLKATDDQGRFAYDFAVVQVIDADAPEVLPPSIHAAYSPTTGIKAGDLVTFKVRTFRVGKDGGREVWDFGDGSAPVAVQSDGNVDIHDPNGYAVTTHAYADPGDYLVRVERTDPKGLRATARLHVRVLARDAPR